MPHAGGTNAGEAAGSTVAPCAVAAVAAAGDNAVHALRVTSARNTARAPSNFSLIDQPTSCPTSPPRGSGARRFVGSLEVSDDSQVILRSPRRGTAYGLARPLQVGMQRQ